MEQLAKDVRFGLRMIRISPGFTAAAVLSPPVEVAERTTGQKKSREEKRIAFDNPLNIGYGRSQSSLERWEGDIHHRPVDEGHTGAEYCGREHPRTATTRRWNRGSGQNHSFVTKAA
jgi:hypothetical protein